MKLTISDPGPIKASLAAIGRQAPFAAATALNTLANKVQSDVRDQVRGGNFVLRRPSFILNTIYRRPGEDFATKTKLQAGVQIHPERDQLAKHEEGGSKRSLKGGSLAVPVNVPRTPAGLIKNAYRPKALLAGSRPKAFVVRPPGRDPIIAEELGRGKNARVRVLFTLKRSVWLKPRLKFHETAQRSLDQHWQPAFEAAITKALDTAR
jgi:hypothetical protein